MPAKLADITISKGKDDLYLLHIEDQDGETLALTATAGQLDKLEEMIDDLLDDEDDDDDESELVEHDDDDNDDDGTMRAEALA